MSTEDSFCDPSLESFFNQLINPFSEQENQLLASQMYQMYNNSNNANMSGGMPSPFVPPPTSSTSTTITNTMHLGSNVGARVSFQPIDPNSSLLGSSSSTGMGGGEIDISPRGGGKMKRAPSPTSSDDQKEEGGPNKQKARRVNQNIASRNYRNRKKEYVTSLETKVHQLATENDSLRKEVAFLKRVDNFDSMKPDPSLITLVVELRHIMSTIEDAVRKDADDNTISYLLQLFHLVVEKRHAVFEKDIEKLVNPFAQAKLAALGYTPVLEHPAVQSVVIGANTAEGWLKKFSEESNMTKEQIGKILLLRDDLTKIDNDLRAERAALDKSIKEFYLHKMRVISFFPTFNFPSGATGHDGKSPSSASNPAGDPVDVSDVIELSRKLNALKKNFATQRNLMVNTFARLGQILTPKQQAILLLRTHINTRFDLTNMELLKNVWQSVTNNESPSVLSLLQIIPSSTPEGGIPTSPVPSPQQPPPSPSHRSTPHAPPPPSSFPHPSMHPPYTANANPLLNMGNLSGNTPNNPISIHSIASSVATPMNTSHLSILTKNDQQTTHIHNSIPTSGTTPDSSKQESDPSSMLLPPSLQVNPLLANLHPSLHGLQQQLHQNQFRTHM